MWFTIGQLLGWQWFFGVLGFAKGRGQDSSDYILYAAPGWVFATLCAIILLIVSDYSGFAEASEAELFFEFIALLFIFVANILASYAFGFWIGRRVERVMEVK